MTELIDQLYGDGVTNILLGALIKVGGPGDLTTSPNPDGTIHVEFAWRSGERIAIKCASDNAHFSYLSTTCGGERETDHKSYKMIATLLPPIFRNAGVKTFTASPQDESSAQTLTDWGGFQRQGYMLVWEL